MRNTIISSSIVAAILAISLSVKPAFAKNETASPTTIKIGYFNLALVKATTPAGDAEGLKNQAESQLRRDIEIGQKAIEKAKTDKKSDEEIKSIVKQVQTELSAKQQALGQLVQAATLQDTQRLVGACNSVAKSKGIDLVVDANSVFAGGKEVLDKGVDLTQDIVKALGGTQSPPSANNGGGAKKADAAETKPESKTE